jgi:hypothetical protein
MKEEQLFNLVEYFNTNRRKKKEEIIFCNKLSPRNNNNNKLSNVGKNKR